MRNFPRTAKAWQSERHVKVKVESLQMPCFFGRRYLRNEHIYIYQLILCNMVENDKINEIQ
jgi:hypothetical protein